MTPLARSLRWKQQLKAQLSAWLFLAPALTILGLFLFYPAVMAFWMSFHDWKSLGGHTWIGLQNYIRLLTFPYFFDAVRNTLYFTLLNVPGTMLVSLAIALLLDVEIRGRQWFRLCFYLPVVTSGAAVSLLWKWILQGGELGLLNVFVASLALPMQDWLGNPGWAMPSIVIVNIWRHVGYYALIFLAGLQAISPEYYEAARVDGANRWHLFRHITLPLLRPAVLLNSILLFIASLEQFEQVYVMTGGGPADSTRTVAFYLFQAWERGQVGMAAAVGYLLFVAVVAITLVQRRLFGQEVAA